ncbi:MAG: T9SS type A sorting domain-containing protein [Balneolaceae bacterium]|nr:T9SS type A sorting domain-containing protein [Balneolaceae bacterium]
MYSLANFRLVISFFIISLFSIHPLFAQTEGFIYKPASTVEGRSILDPNGTGNVFQDGVPFYAMPQLQEEPVGDPRTGASGGHTDLIAGADGSPAAFMFYDSEKEAVLFRVRLAGQSTASKGYSFLFNTAFEAFGPQSSTYTQTNPGFQFEVVLETGTGVTIYELDQNGIASINTLPGGENPYFQKAVSDLTANNLTGFFYDFYVPLSALDGLLSPTDSFKAVATTVTRAQSGITGTLSDIAGVDDRLYRNRNSALVSYIESVPPTTLNDLTEGGSGFGDILNLTNTPTISAPLFSGSTSISGFINEEAGTNIQVFVNGVSVGTVQSTAQFSWSISGIGPLNEDDVVTAVATASGKDPSETGGPVTVLDGSAKVVPCLDSISINPITVNAVGTGSGIRIASIEGTAPGLDTLIDDLGASNVSILVYQAGTIIPGEFRDRTGGNLTVGGQAGPYIFSEISGTRGELLQTAEIDGFSLRLDLVGVNNTGLDGEKSYELIFFETQETFTNPPDCFTERSPIFSLSTISLLERPVIDQSVYSSDDTVVTGTASTGDELILYINGIYDPNRVVTIDPTTRTWSFSGLNLVDGDEITAIARNTTTGVTSPVSLTSVVTTDSTDDPILQSTPPIITGEYFTTQTNATIEGSSAESAGTTINIFINGDLVGTAIVDTFGNWELEGVDLSGGGTLTATSIAPNKTESDVSEPVTILTGQSNSPNVQGPIRTGDTTITVTGGSGLVTLYIDGEAVATKEGSGEVVFEAGVDYDLGDLYRGAVVTATNQDSEVSAESDESGGVTVESVETFLIEYVDAEGNILNAGDIATQTPNEPFFIRITALDGSGTVFTNFTGSATLTFGFDATPESSVTANFVDGVLAVHQITALNGAEDVSISAVSQDDPTVSGSSNEFDILGESEFEVTLSLGPCWRALSSPIQNGTFADLLGEIWTQGAEGSSYQPGSPNIFTWPNSAPNESSEWENSNNLWQPVTDMNQVIPAGTGFLVSVFADNNFDGTDDEDPVTISVSGFERLADVSPELNENSDGWTLVGNPYTGPIDFDLLGRVDLTDVAYVYDRSAGGDNSGAWLSYSVGVGGDLTDGLIAPFQGFFIQNDGDDASVTFTESARTTVEATFYGKENTREFVRLQLEGEGLKNSAWINFSEEGNNSLIRGDALQLTPFSENYAMLATGKNDTLLDVGIYPSINSELEIPVMIETTLSGRYTITATDFHIHSQASELVFVDLQENVTIPFDDSFSYTFHVNSAMKLNVNALTCSDDPQTVANKFYPQKAASTSGRFVIRSSNSESNSLPTSYSLNQNYPNPFNPSTTIRYELPVQSDVQLAVYDLTGRQVALLVNGMVEGGRHTVQFDGSGLASGVYIYRLQAGGQLLTRKLTLIK